MRPTLFTIGSLPIRGYGLMVAIAFLAAIYVAARRASKEGIPSQTIFDLGLYILISALLGARIFYSIQFRSSYDSFTDFLKIWQGGLVYYGGFISAFVVGVLYMRWKKLSIPKVLDIFAPSMMLGLSIGRIGCFLAGCCFGKPTSLPWGVTFPEGSMARLEFGEVPIHPTQLYSFVSVFSIFIILIVLRRYMKFSGQVFLLTVFIYSIHRFLIDFLRYYAPNERFGSLSSAQVISIVAGTTALVAMIVFTVWQSRHTSTTKARQPKRKEK